MARHRLKITRVSNVLIVGFAAPHRGPLLKWLDKHSTQREWRMLPWSRDREILIASRGLETCLRDGLFFRGTAVSPETRAIAFGVDGWLSLPSRLHQDPHGVGGEFVLATWDEHGLAIRRDVFSCQPLLYTSGNGFVAISDSLLVLADLRRELGEFVTQNAEAILARCQLSSHATQQIGPETYVNEVAFLPAARGLCIDAARLSVSMDGCVLGDRLVRDEKNYRWAIREAAGFVAGTVAAVAAIDRWSTIVLLSGGYDSRVVLAAALRTGTIGRIAVKSLNDKPEHRVDFERAQALAERFTFALNRPANAGAPEALGFPPVAIWASTTLGTYDRPVPKSSKRWQPRAVEMTGLGGEILKGNWHWTDWRAMIEPFRAAGPVREAFDAQGRKGLAALGVHPEWADASELYYAGYRNGLHGSGGHIATHMLAVQPLQQLRLAALAHTRTDEARDPLEERHRARFRGSYDALADLLVLMHPELAAMPYDKPEKALSPGRVAARARELGGGLTDTEVEAVTIFGHPERVPAGPTRLGVSIATSRGFGIPWAADPLLVLCARFAEGIHDRTARSTLYSLLEPAIVRLRQGEPVDGGPARVPKLLSAGVFGGC